VIIPEKFKNSKKSFGGVGFGLWGDGVKVIVEKREELQTETVKL